MNINIRQTIFVSATLIATTLPVFAASNIDGTYKGKMTEARGACRLSEREQIARIINGHFSMLWDSRHGKMAEGEVSMGNNTITTSFGAEFQVTINNKTIDIVNNNDGCYQHITLIKE